MTWFDNTSLKATVKTRDDIEAFIRRELRAHTKTTFNVEVRIPIGYNHINIHVDSRSGNYEDKEALAKFRSRHEVRNDVHLLEVLLNLADGHQSDSHLYGFMPAGLTDIFIVREGRDHMLRRKVV